VVATRQVVTTVPGKAVPGVRPVAGTRQVVTSTVGGSPVVTSSGRIVGCSNVGGARGRWFRRGNKIVLVGG
jgi:hypothetical protein